MTIKPKIFALLLPIAASSQITFTNPEGAPVNFLTKNKSYEDVEAAGSPYLEEEFKYGRVYAYDSLQIKGEMRYNAYKSEIEVAEKDDSYFSLLKRPYITVQIEDDWFKMLPYKDENDLDRVAYFNPLNQGEAVLLFKPEVKLRRGRVPNTSYDRYVPPTYLDISSYYIKLGEEPARKIRLKKKDLLQALKAKKEAVVEYVKENDLKLNRESDAIRLINYYNTL